MRDWKEVYPDWVDKNGNLKPRAPIHVRQYVYDEKLSIKNPGVKRLEAYKGTKTKILHRCSCGDEYLINPDSGLAGGKCKTCRYQKVREKNGFSQEEYDEELAERGAGVVRLGQYVNVHTPIQHRCVCGNQDWYPIPTSVLRGSRCKKCGDKERASDRTHSTEKYLADLKNKSIKIKPLEPYQNSNVEILHRCECGEEFLAKPNTVLRGYGCPACAHHNRSHGRDHIMNDHDGYLSRLEEKERGHIKVLEKYRGVRVPILHECPDCGKPWLVQPDYVLHKRPCCSDCAIFNADNDALYLLIDAAGIYKIGHTSWVDPSKRFKPMIRSRANHKPNPIPQISQMLRIVRVEGNASEHENRLLLKYTDNPYRGALFDGSKETRELSKSQLIEVLEYIDSVSSEKANLSTVNSELKKYLNGKDLIVGTDDVGFHSKRLINARREELSILGNFEERWFPDEKSALEWKYEKPQITERALANFNTAKPRKNGEDLPTGIFEEQKIKKDKVYSNIKIVTRFGGLVRRKSISFGLDKTREEAIELAIDARKQHIDQILCELGLNS